MIIAGWEYKTVNIRTLAGLKQAERLHMAGWKQTSACSGNSIQFYRPSKGNKKRQ